MYYINAKEQLRLLFFIRGGAGQQTLVFYDNPSILTQRF
jgi:hypothetical protein